MRRPAHSLKLNVVANFVGGGWQSLINIAFVPLYLKYLGIESYGLIGAFASLQAFMAVFDFGLAPTLNRELARLSSLPDKAGDMRDMTRTLEVLTWSFALTLGSLLLLISPFIALHWLQPKTLSVAVVTQSFAIMSVGFAFQWAANLYSNALAALQKQVLMNVTNAVFVTLRSVGALVVIVFVSQTLPAFLAWQALIAALQSLVMALLVWRNLPASPSPARFRSVLLKQVWRFAAGMTGILIVSLILLQTDKVILSRMLTLQDFGYYTLAGTIAGVVLGVIVSPINIAVYPKFSQLAAINDEVSLRQLYHQSCQLMSVLVLPTASVLAFFSWEVLRIWTRNEAIAANTYILLAIVAAVAGLTGLMMLPYRLQLAYGWTRLSLYANVVAIIMLVPIMILAVSRYGAIGGAASLLGLNVAYTLVPLPIMHRKILRGELKKWYWSDVGMPLLATLCVMGISSALLPKQASTAFIVVWLGLTWVGAVALASLVAPDLRERALQIVKPRLYSIKAT